MPEIHNIINNIPYWQIKLALFKKKAFRSFLGVDYPKQEMALNWLSNPYAMQLLYGGAAGGGKSFLSWTWLVFSALAFPGTAWFFAREQLKDARLFGLQSYKEVCDNYKIPTIGKNALFSFNGQDNYLRCYNGSVIYLLELKHKPSDTQYQYLGSRLFTGGAIEEAGQINFDAFETLWVRCGRYRNQRYNIAPKLLLLANPTKNFLYHDFYIPHTKNNLQAPKKYIQAFVYDNPFQTTTYIDSLKNLQDPVRRARLYEGNWHYLSDETTLFDYDNLQAIFTNDYVLAEGQKFISVDRAGQGKDKSILLVAHGLRIIEVIEEAKSTHDSLCELIKRVAKKHQIPMFNVVVDAGGLSDVHHSLGCQGFLGGSRSKQDIYPNLKTECAYQLSKLVENGKLFIDAKQPNLRDVICHQLEAVKRAKIDADDGKLYINKKDAQKALLGGKSPDYADALIMLMLFHIKGAAKQPFYHTFNPSTHISNTITLSSKMPLYFTINLSDNFQNCALVSQINVKTKIIKHLDCISSIDKQGLCGLINNYDHKDKKVFVIKKDKSLYPLKSVENNYANRKEMILLLKNIGLNVSSSNYFDLQRSIKADKELNYIYNESKNVDGFKFRISPKCTPLISEKKLLTPKNDLSKDTTQACAFTDCEAYFISNLFH